VIPHTKYSALLMKRIPVVHFFGVFLAFHFVIHLLSPFEFHCCHDVICKKKFLWLTGQTMLFPITRNNSVDSVLPSNKKHSGFIRCLPIAVLHVYQGPS